MAMIANGSAGCKRPGGVLAPSHCLPPNRAQTSAPQRIDAECHVWTAPAMQEESDVCSKRSGWSAARATSGRRCPNTSPSCGRPRPTQGPRRRSTMATPTAEDRFKYNLLAERINELGAILVAACRADPGFLSWPVREELEGAAAFLTGGQLDRTTVRPTLEPDGPLRDAVARGM